MSLEVSLSNEMAELCPFKPLNNPHLEYWQQLFLLPPYQDFRTVPETFIKIIFWGCIENISFLRETGRTNWNPINQIFDRLLILIKLLSRKLGLQKRFRVSPSTPVDWDSIFDLIASQLVNLLTRKPGSKKRFRASLNIS